MAGFFGSTLTVAVDENDDASFTTLGEVISCTPPGKSFEMVDFTVLGDTVQQLKPSPIETAPELTVTVLADRTQAEQAAIDGVIGDSTFHSWQLVHPWASADTQDFEGCVREVSYGEITPDGRIEATYVIVGNTTVTWS